MAVFGRIIRYALTAITINHTRVLRRNREVILEIPPNFDLSFLTWLRTRTERAWEEYQTADFQLRRMTGTDWQRGTKWMGGLSHAEIDHIEQEWSTTFPSDYRAFLSQLHAVDRPMLEGSFEGKGIVVTRTPAFYNWLTDKSAIAEALARLTDGLLFDVRYNGLWLSSWGDMPNSSAERVSRVRRVAASAPRLIPVFGHRYLLVEPCEPGNPVFSIYQSDITLYGSNLREYLLLECTDLLGLSSAVLSSVTTSQSAMKIRQIPFWGDLYVWRRQRSR